MKNPPSLKVTLHLFIVITILCWGSAFVAIRVGLQGYTPGALALIRYLIGSLCILIPFLSLKKPSHISHRDKISMLILGAFTVGGYHLCLNYGELHVQAGIASFITSQSPIITVLLAYVFLQERLSSKALAGMCVSTIGMMLILFAEDRTLDMQIDCIFIILACIAGGVSSVVQKIYLKKYHYMEVSAYFFWGGMLSLIFFLPALLNEVFHAGLIPSIAALYLGIFPTTIASILWSYILLHMTATRSTNYLYLMPLVATLIGWIGLGEVPASMALVGGLLALMGVWLVNHGHSRR